VEDTISILRGLKERYEVHHGCASRTVRWWPPRCWPTATSPTGSCPTRPSTWSTRGRPVAHRDRFHAGGADEITRRILQLEIEREALKKETDAASGSPTKLEEELAQLQEKAKRLREQWEREKAAIEKPRQLRAVSRRSS
jgi:ATP-dependent Clp protease ATP-binding subunit ClpB